MKNSLIEPVVIDGHTRLQAAIDAGIDDIPVVIQEFASLEHAISEAIRLQANRRNLTGAALLALVDKLDQRKLAGRPRELASADANLSRGKSAAETAKVLNVSPSTVERARTVLDSGNEDLKESVRRGDL